MSWAATSGAVARYDLILNFEINDASTVLNGHRKVSSGPSGLRR